MLASGELMAPCALITPCPCMREQRDRNPMREQSAGGHRHGVGRKTEQGQSVGLAGLRSLP